MVNYLIQVGYDGKEYIYNMSVVLHAIAGQTIRWEIDPKYREVVSNLRIHFGNGHPFDKNTAQPDKPDTDTDHTFNNNHKKRYKYDVSLTYNGKPQKPDDPEIMFDDGY